MEWLLLLTISWTPPSNPATFSLINQFWVLSKPSPIVLVVYHLATLQQGRPMEFTAGAPVSNNHRCSLLFVCFRVPWFHGTGEDVRFAIDCRQQELDVFDSLGTVRGCSPCSIYKLKFSLQYKLNLSLIFSPLQSYVSLVFRKSIIVCNVNETKVSKYLQ